MQAWGCVMTWPPPGIDWYYADGFCAIAHGDCREILPSVEMVDAIVTDPPYGTGYYAEDKDAGSVIKGLDAPVLAVFGYPEHLCHYAILRSAAPDEWVTWWATNAALRGFTTVGLRRESEHIAIWGKAPRWRDVRQAVARPELTASANAHGRGRTNSERKAERVYGDVWRDASPGLGFQSHLRQHVNEKPLAVMMRLVDMVTKPGATVLDPFMGSGTTLRAAKDLGRKAIGIEIEERYCSIAAKRLAQEVLDVGAAA